MKLGIVAGIVIPSDKSSFHFRRRVSIAQSGVSSPRYSIALRQLPSCMMDYFKELNIIRQRGTLSFHVLLFSSSFGIIYRILVMNSAICYYNTKRAT